MSEQAQHTIIEKPVAFRRKTINLNADGGIFAQYELGSLEQDGSFRVISEKNYMLTSIEAASILAAPTTGGAVGEELTKAVTEALSQRGDWLV